MLLGQKQRPDFRGWQALPFKRLQTIYHKCRFADIFIVYAKINGTDFTAFIVEKGDPGFTMGPEEKKMGIKGSSTRPLYFEDVRVPVENLLGEIGKGHLIAFNILNIGRYKLATGCLGASKETIELAVEICEYPSTVQYADLEISTNW